MYNMSFHDDICIHRVSLGVWYGVGTTSWAPWIEAQIYTKPAAKTL